MGIGESSTLYTGGVYVGTTPMEGNFTISIKLLMHLLLTQKYTSGKHTTNILSSMGIDGCDKVTLCSNFCNSKILEIIMLINSVLVKITYDSHVDWNTLYTLSKKGVETPQGLVKSNF